MIDWKSLATSKTVLSVIVGLITGIAVKYGFLVDGISVESLITDIIAIATSAAMIYVRAVATKVIVQK